MDEDDNDDALGECACEDVCNGPGYGIVEVHQAGSFKERNFEELKPRLDGKWRRTAWNDKNSYSVDGNPEGFSRIGCDVLERRRRGSGSGAGSASDWRRGSEVEQSGDFLERKIMKFGKIDDAVSEDRGKPANEGWSGKNTGQNDEENKNRVSQTRKKSVENRNQEEMIGKRWDKRCRHQHNLSLRDEKAEKRHPNPNLYIPGDAEITEERSGDALSSSSSSSASSSCSSNSQLNKRDGGYDDDSIGDGITDDGDVANDEDVNDGLSSFGWAIVSLAGLVLMFFLPLPIINLISGRREGVARSFARVMPMCEDEKSPTVATATPSITTLVTPLHGKLFPIYKIPY